MADAVAEQIAALGKKIPDFKAGDTVRIGYKVTEGTRSRVQAYEGVVCGGDNLAVLSLWGERGCWQNALDPLTPVTPVTPVTPDRTGVTGVIGVTGVTGVTGYRLSRLG